MPAASDAARGIACRFGEAWHVDIAVAVPDVNGSTPASSAPVASLDAYLDALGAEGLLGTDEGTRRR